MIATIHMYKIIVTAKSSTAIHPSNKIKAAIFPG